MPPVPIITYHRIGPQLPPDPLESISPETFAVQMRRLHRAGYTSIGFDLLLEHRENGHPLPPRPVIIAFDDGYQDYLDHAVPILRRYGFTAMFYLVAGLMGQRSSWTEPSQRYSRPIMGWDGARELLRQGFHCGGHTLTHPRLARLTANECRYELVESRRILEEQLDRPIRHLAYPYGSQNSEVRALAMAAGYQTACCSVSSRRVTPADEVFALPRIGISARDSSATFVTRVLTGHSIRTLTRATAEQVLPGPVFRAGLGVWRRLRSVIAPAALTASVIAG